MSKFIIEYRDNRYVMSFVDDILPVETRDCSSLDESLYEMIEIFKDRSKIKDEKIIESMRCLYDLFSSSRIPVELIGINLINSDPIRELVSNKFGNISREYMEFVRSN